MPQLSFGAAAAPPRQPVLPKPALPKDKAADIASAIAAAIEAGTKASKAAAVPLAQQLAYTIPQAARYIGCSPSTLRKWMKLGIGPESFHLHGKKHLILHTELERWLKERAGR